ncbi:hypothetical protein TRFO_28172 [Tritrichomonas foetus]|uniref:Uncharacterized protein n=1 Tax=Tritrichomonas foetus TaxID=1144522 RepID=A0A1J4JYW2_9EUKA|nr:hypothetical protein TRFO_28172 [Tritrichomonas foetus]|eukprot:OHT04345.1 hypothetical protein TRFO_28172 [Tritrichomonas foetus]
MFIEKVNFQCNLYFVMNLVFKHDNLKDKNESLEKTTLYSSIMSTRIPTFRNFQSMINHFQKLITDFSQMEDKSISPNEQYLKRLTYYCICRYISENSDLIVPLIPEDFRGFDLPTELDIPITKNIYEISPETLPILYFVKYYKPKGGNQSERQFLEKFYSHFTQKYFQFRSKFCLLKVFCVKILTKALIWMNEYYPCFAVAPAYINENRIVLFCAIAKLISNNFSLYAHQTGVKCLLKILQNNIYSDDLLKFIPLLMNVSNYQCTLNNIYQCITYLIIHTNNEYLTISTDFLNRQKFHEFSYESMIAFLEMMSIFISNNKIGDYQHWEELIELSIEYILFDYQNYETLLLCSKLLFAYFKDIKESQEVIINILKKKIIGYSFESIKSRIRIITQIFIVSCTSIYEQKRILKQQSNNCKIVQKNENPMSKEQIIIRIAEQYNIPLKELIPIEEIILIEKQLSFENHQIIIDTMSLICQQITQGFNGTNNHENNNDFENNNDT